MEKDEVASEEEEELEEQEEVLVRKHRKKPTVEEHMKRYDELLKLLDSEIERKCKEREKGVRTLQALRKTLKILHKEVPYITHTRKKFCTTPKRTSGFMTSQDITPELAKFLGIEEDTPISRTDATRAICVYSNLKAEEDRPEMLRWKHLNKDGLRNLQDPNNKRAILPDKTLSKLLRYDKYKADVKAGLITCMVKDDETGDKRKTVLTDSSLYYWTIQKLINVHFKTSDKKTKVTKET